MNPQRQDDAPGIPIFDVRAFGAAGDGRTKDTAAIQAAIDRCAEQGGGQVTLPAGFYLSGTLYLKDDIELHLGAGAVLRGSPDRADYNAGDLYPETTGSKTEHASAAHLVIAYCRRNVSVTGPGVIDGNSAAFYGGLHNTDEMPYRYKVRPVKSADIAWRPSQMVWFCRCNRVLLRDVTLTNPPYWACLLLGCTDVRVRGLISVNPPTTLNGDGLDIDCCRNVTVSDCIIRSGDDCLTLRADSEALGNHAQACENVVVSNCVLSSPCCAIRVGVGDGEIRRCRLSNIIVTDARTGISVVSRWSSAGAHGTRITDVRFSNFTMDCWNAFHIANSHYAHAQPPARIADLSFERFHIRATGASRIGGDPERPIRNLCFRDIEWRLARDEQAPRKQPWMIEATHLEDCRFENIRGEREQDADDVTEGFHLGATRDVTFRQVEFRVNGDAPFADGLPMGASTDSHP